jgi:hypothetical protein
VVPPLHFEYADGLLEAAQFVVPEVGEEEALAGAELRTAIEARISPPLTFAAIREARMTEEPKRSLPPSGPASSIGSPAGDVGAVGAGDVLDAGFDHGVDCTRGALSPPPAPLPCAGRREIRTRVIC